MLVNIPFPVFTLLFFPPLAEHEPVCCCQIPLHVALETDPETETRATFKVCRLSSQTDSLGQYVHHTCWYGIGSPVHSSRKLGRFPSQLLLCLFLQAQPYTVIFGTKPDLTLSCPDAKPKLNLYT